MTDSLDMDAVLHFVSRRDAVIKAISAGNDLLMIKNVGLFDPYLPQNAMVWIREAIEAVFCTSVISFFRRIVCASSKVHRRTKRERVNEWRGDWTPRRRPSGQWLAQLFQRRRQSPQCPYADRLNGFPWQRFAELCLESRL